MDSQGGQPAQAPFTIEELAPYLARAILEDGGGGSSSSSSSSGSAIQANAFRAALLLKAMQAAERDRAGRPAGQ